MQCPGSKPHIHWHSPLYGSHVDHIGCEQWTCLTCDQSVLVIKRGPDRSTDSKNNSCFWNISLQSPYPPPYSVTGTNEDCLGYSLAEGHVLNFCKVLGLFSSTTTKRKPGEIKSIRILLFLLNWHHGAWCTHLQSQHLWAETGGSGCLLSSSKPSRLGNMKRCKECQLGVVFQVFQSLLLGALRLEDLEVSMATEKHQSY